MLEVPGNFSFRNRKKKLKARNVFQVPKFPILQLLQLAFLSLHIYSQPTPNIPYSSQDQIDSQVQNNLERLNGNFISGVPFMFNVQELNVLRINESLNIDQVNTIIINQTEITQNSNQSSDLNSLIYTDENTSEQKRYRNQVQQPSSVCVSNSIAEIQTRVLGQSGMWLSTLENFCALQTLDDVQPSNNASQTCCQVANQIVNGACYQYACYVYNGVPRTPLLQPASRSRIVEWQIVCELKGVLNQNKSQNVIENCPILDALDFMTGEGGDILPPQADIAIQQTNYQSYGQQVNMQVNIQFDFDSEQNQQQITDSQSNNGTIIFGLLNEQDWELILNQSPPVSERVRTDDLFEAIQEMKELSSFYNNYKDFIDDYARRLGKQPQNQITFFAPSNEVFQQREIDYNLDQIVNMNVLLLHIIKEPISATIQEPILLITYDMELNRNETLVIQPNVDGTLFVQACCDERNSATTTYFQSFENGDLYVINNILLPSDVARQVYS